MKVLERLHARFGQDFTDRPDRLAEHQGLKALLGEALMEEADEETRQASKFGFKLLWLAAGLILGGWLVYTLVSQWRIDQLGAGARTVFSATPGYVVTGGARQGSQYHLEGLRDPLAAASPEVLSASGIDPEKLQMNWRPFQSLDPVIIERRIAQSLKFGPETKLSLSGTELTVSGPVSADQLAALQRVPGAHAGISSVSLDGTLLNADEAIPHFRAALSVPESVTLVPSGGQMRLTGTASAGWYQRATAMDVETYGWRLDFGPLRQTLEQQFAERAAGIDGTELHFVAGARLTDASRALLDPVAADLIALQALERALGRDPGITLEGLGDGIGTEEKNREVAFSRTSAIAEVLADRGVEVSGLRQVFGDWEEGGLNPNRRKVTIRVERGESE